MINILTKLKKLVPDEGRILAFAGSSLNTLIIIVLYRLPYIRLINLDLIGVELIQGISGSIGIVLTVPITALCAAFLATRKKEG